MFRTICKNIVLCMSLVPCMLFYPMNLFADTHVAADCAVATIQALHDDAGVTTGDIISLPICTATWASTLTITKAITLQGAGVSSSVLTHSAGADPMIALTPGSDKAIRVTGIGFVLTASNGDDVTAIKINGSKTGAYSLTQIRIDGCYFTSGKRQIAVSGHVYGVIDSNTFLNGNIAIDNTGASNYIWSQVIEAGTSNAMFIEDNNFTITNDATYEPNHQIYHYDGGKTVTRYNKFDGSGYTAVGKYCYFFDSHGNDNYYTGSGDTRGQPILEIYNNTFSAYRGNANTFQVRSGSTLIHDNAFSTDTGTMSVPYFYEEEIWVTGNFSPLATSYPAEDQIANTFVWSNTCNWSGATCNGSVIIAIVNYQINSECVGLDDPNPCCTGSGTGTCDDFFIVQDRDYFLHAPQSSGGKSVYSGDGNQYATYSASGANAYYPYTPYTYPHPLRGIQVGQVTGSFGGNLR